MITVDITGIDETIKELNTLKDNIQKFNGNHTVQFGELFSDSFMQEHSSFSSINELLCAGNLNIVTQEDFEMLSDDELDKHIATYTDFDNWEQMQLEAYNHYISKQLGF